MLPLLPPEITYEILDFGLHFRPEKWKGDSREKQIKAWKISNCLDCARGEQLDNEAV